VKEGESPAKGRGKVRSDAGSSNMFIFQGIPGFNDASRKILTRTKPLLMRESPHSGRSNQSYNSVFSEAHPVFHSPVSMESCEEGGRYKRVPIPHVADNVPDHS